MIRFEMGTAQSGYPILYTHIHTHTHTLTHQRAANSTQGEGHHRVLAARPLPRARPGSRYGGGGTVGPRGSGVGANAHTKNS